MRVSFEVNMKAVLAVVAVAGLSVGSFYAGERYQAHKTKTLDPHVATSATADDPFAAIAMDIIPDGTTEETWCRSHPNSKWTYGPAKSDPSDRYHLSDGLVPKHGGCDASGNAWVISDKP
jgi:hypothetical protein